MVGMLEQSRELAGAASLYYVNHRRVAKKRARAIWYARGADRRGKLYRELLKVTQATLGYVESVDACLKQAGVCGVGYEGWVSQVRYFVP